ncbi:MAG: hypothetical protein KA886_07775 [Candidatus Cloacimonetes bacterium]|nr:hypothetical protein [Candidatus Cloacimonadota bacterium]
MGRTILMMVILLTIVVGTIIVTINKEQLKLVDTLSQDNDMNLAKFISNTYAHNTVKDIRDAYISGKSEAINKLVFSPSLYKNQPQSGLTKILGIDNASIKVSIYNAQNFPGPKPLEAGKEWGVVSIGRVNSAVCTTKVVYKRMPYSEFGFFTDNFPTNVYFGDGEVIDGPAYINGKLRVGTSEGSPTVDAKNKNKGNPNNKGNHYGWYKKRSKTLEYPADAGPVFTDLVYITAKVDTNGYQKYIGGVNLSQPADFINYYNGFKAEAPTFDYPVISMPNNQFNISTALRSAALNPMSDGTKNWQYMYITLKDDVIEIKRTHRKSNGYLETFTDNINMSSMNSYNNLIYNASTVPVYVKGSLNGKLTIATEGTMYADGSIIYTSVKNNLEAFKAKCIAGEYEALPNNDQSILGLLAATKFVVQANTTNKGTTNPIVMANIFTKGMIEITEGQNYNNYPWSTDEGRHFIVYGSRVQGLLQPGTFTVTSSKKKWYKPKGWAWGWWKWRVTYSGGKGLKEVLIYDRRFKEMSPPCTPYTDKGARISYWDERFGRIKSN